MVSREGKDSLHSPPEKGIVLFDIIDRTLTVAGHSEYLYIIFRELYSAADTGKGMEFHIFPEFFHLACYQLFGEEGVYLEDIIPDQPLTMQIFEDRDTLSDVEQNELRLWIYAEQRLYISARSSTYKRLWKEALEMIVEDYFADRRTPVDDAIKVTGLADQMEIIKPASGDNYGLVELDYQRLLKG